MLHSPQAIELTARKPDDISVKIGSMTNQTKIEEFWHLIDSSLASRNIRNAKIYF